MNTGAKEHRQGLFGYRPQAIMANKGASNHSPSTGLILLSFIVCLMLWYGIETLNYENGTLCLNAYSSSKEALQQQSQLLKSSSGQQESSMIMSHHKHQEEEGSYVISLAGRNLTCLPSYSAPFRNILLVIQFTVRVGQLEKDIEDLYKCFFPHIKRYTYCDPNSEEEKANGMTCIQDPTPDYAAPFPEYTYTPSWFQYDFMADAMEKNPDFEGYIFIQEGR